jgi:hypothetical protein
MEPKEVAVESGKSLLDAVGKPGAGAGGIFGVLGLIAGAFWYYNGIPWAWDCRQLNGQRQVVHSITSPSVTHTATGTCSQMIKVPVLGIFENPVKLAGVLGIVFAFAALISSTLILLYRQSQRERRAAAHR